MNIYLVIILTVLIGKAVLEITVELLNLRYLSPHLPKEFEGFYDREKYRTSQVYLRDNTRLGIIEELILTPLTIVFILGGGFNLRMIDNTVDETTGTISLRAAIPNPDRKLWPGQYATVKLIVSTAKDAVLVPVPAVQLGQKGMFLYVITGDNKADLRDKITVGQSQGGKMIIEKGIKVGEKVVTYGQLGLSPGAQVRIVTGDEQ